MKPTKKIILAGGSGYLGRALENRFINEYDEIVILTRGKSSVNGKTKHVNWDGKSGGEWQRELEGAETVINLTGKNVNCRYNEKNKEEIISSRVDSTNIIGKTIEKLNAPPELWINLASATIYPHSEHSPMTESHTGFENDFSVQVCKAWEKAFFSFKPKHTRQVCLRVAMIFGNGGGVFPVLKNLVRLGLGGAIGNGKQMVSWMDEEDFLRMVEWSISNKTVAGIYNCTAPDPLTNREMMKLMRKEMKVPIGLPAPEPLLALGCFVLQTEPELVLKSRYVIPERATKEGFTFLYPGMQESLIHLLNSKK